MKFNDVIKEQVDLLGEADPNLDPNLGGVPQGGMQGGMQGGPPGDSSQQGIEEPPMPDELEPEEPKPLTSEGARFLTELALRALAFNPDNLTSQEKSLFQDDVTAENAEEILERIQQILDTSSGSSDS